MQWNFRFCSFYICFFLLVACGDSPFLKGDKRATGEQGLSATVKTLPHLGLQASIEWQIGPSLDFENSLLLKLEPLHREGLINITTITALIRMPEMSHGAYPIQIHSLAKNQYLLSEIIFFMPGLWHLKIGVTTEAGYEEVIWSYQF